MVHYGIMVHNVFLVTPYIGNKTGKFSLAAPANNINHWVSCRISI